MSPTFRQSMSWLHTWVGVVLGSVLFAVFWMGTLSVFDREIDRWMMPGTRLPPPAPGINLDRLAAQIQAMVPARTTRWRIWLPDKREPVLRLSYRGRDGGPVVRHFNADTGALIADQGTLAGTGFIFPFHFNLHLKGWDIGYWLVGIAAMAMLVLVVSGVVIHRGIFVDFFTFRFRGKAQRASLDLHSLTGVLALPFHFFITLSGLIIFIGIYFPQAYTAAYSGEPKAVYSQEAFGRFSRPKTNRPGELASLDAMVERVRHDWEGDMPYMIRVWHPGDANAYVEMRRSFAGEVSRNLDQIYFDAASGDMLYRFKAAPAIEVQRFFIGLHFIQFEHWPLRLLYFLCGVGGCVLIATGFLFWLGARRKAHAKQGGAGLTVVQGLAIGTITGIAIATLAFWVCNRLLPLQTRWLGADRAELEVWCFYVAWLAAFAHAFWRQADAWRGQCWTIALLAVAAVLLNAVTTGDHLVRTLKADSWSSIAGMDLALVSAALIAILAARRLERQKKTGAESGRRHSA